MYVLDTLWGQYMPNPIQLLLLSLEWNPYFTVLYGPSRNECKINKRTYLGNENHSIKNNELPYDKNLTTHLKYRHLNISNVNATRHTYVYRKQLARSLSRARARAHTHTHKRKSCNALVPGYSHQTYSHILNLKYWTHKILYPSDVPL